MTAYNPASNSAHNKNMITDAQWRDLHERHEMAYFRGQLATDSPQSYAIEEMREISSAMDASTAEVEAALHADFSAMPPRLQAAMLDMLQKVDPGNYDWWTSVLVGEMPDTPEQVAASAK